MDVIGQSVLKIFAPVLWAVVAAAMLQAVVAVDENLSSALSIVTAHVFTLYFFSVVIERSFEFV